MIAILTLVALLLGGNVSPNDGLPGGPSITATVSAPAVSPPVDDGLPGGPSITP